MQRQLQYVRSRDVEQAFASGLDLLIVPVGCTGFGGRELPLGYGNVLVEAFALAIAETQNGFYLPVIPYSPGEGAWGLPGSICPEPTAFLKYVYNVVDQAIDNEFKRVVVIMEGTEGYLVSCDTFERKDHPVLVLSPTSLMGHDDLAPKLPPKWNKQIDVLLGALSLLGREELIGPLIERLRRLPAEEAYGLDAAQLRLLELGHIDAYERSTDRNRMHPDVRFDAQAGRAYISAVAKALGPTLDALGRYTDFIDQRTTFKKDGKGNYGWTHAS